MAQTRLAFLFQKYFDKTATPEEAAEFILLAAMDENAAEVQTLMDHAWVGFDYPDPVFSPTQSEAMLQSVLGRTGNEGVSGEGRVPEGIGREGAGSGAAGGKMEDKRVRRIGWSKIAAAAMLTGVLAGAAWWWSHKPVSPLSPMAKTSRSPHTSAPTPPSNKAILILDNGTAITLDSAQPGAVVTQGNTRITKVGGNQLAYNNAGQNNNEQNNNEQNKNGQSKNGQMASAAPVFFNTVRTARGGQYQVTLPDGSKVWLNAASSLHFPTAFTGKDRTVELTGEAYFEIQQNAALPFRVRVNDMTVDVLGTHFNIMAYEDEGSINTSLLQGEVRVEEGSKARLLRPGQEARCSRDTKDLLIEASDTEQVMAWKNGLFQFEGAALESVMRQLGRWYDIDVRYVGAVQQHFTGMIPRTASLPQVLHILGRAGKARFTLEGKTLTVSPM
jgi:transmembrane sensor